MMPRSTNTSTLTHHTSTLYQNPAASTDNEGGQTMTILTL